MPKFLPVSFPYVEESTSEGKHCMEHVKCDLFEYFKVQLNDGTRDQGLSA